MNDRDAGILTANDRDLDLAGRGERSASSVIINVINVLRHRKWIILSAVAVALAAGLVVTLLMTREYSAKSVVEIQRETGNFTAVRGAEENKTSTVDQEFYQTQYGLLRAQTLAELVGRNLGLQDDPAFFKTFGVRDAADWFEGRRLKPGAPSREARLRMVGAILLENVSVQPQRLSRLIDIVVTTPDPLLSQRIANTWVSSFIEMTLNRRYGATAYARRFLEQRLAQLRDRIDESERRLVSYAGAEQIINLPSGAGENGATTERALVIDDLASANAELSRAVADRLRVEAQLRNASSAADLASQTVGNLRQRREELAAEYARLMVQFEPSYPPAAAIQRQVQSLDRAIAAEKARISGSVKDSYDAAVDREQRLRARVTQLKSGVLDERRRSIQYNIYQRDVDTNRQLYDGLLQRFKEIGIAGGVGVNNISQVDAADLPLKPSSPRLSINLAIALLAGLVVGIGLAFALEQIDQGITDPSDVEADLKVPLLGTVPRVSDEDRINSLLDPKSALAEAYISLQTALAFSTAAGLPRTIAITSSRPAEGKTTTSTALAYSFARSGRRTVLVDADMRSPSIHHRLNIANDVGLSSYLTGSAAMDEIIVAVGQNNLVAIPAGHHPPSAPELLGSDRFGAFLRELLTRFDHVVLDAPPVMGLADAPLIGSQVDGLVFVIESEATQKGLARVALERLRTANVPILGAVLTKFDARRARFDYGYSYGYGYGADEAASGRSAPSKTA
nr:polysaccharide biosynthesis tyrosine autokinase [Sphingomonas sp. MA1305]